MSDRYGDLNMTTEAMPWTAPHQAALEQYAAAEAQREAEEVHAANVAADLALGRNPGHRAMADRYSRDEITYGELSSTAKEILVEGSANPNLTRIMFDMSDAGRAEDEAHYDQQQQLWELQGEAYEREYEAQHGGDAAEL